MVTDGEIKCRRRDSFFTTANVRTQLQVQSAFGYLGDGAGILDNFNEAGVWTSCDAAIRDKSKIQTFLFPQLCVCGGGGGGGGVHVCENV